MGLSSYNGQAGTLEAASGAHASIITHGPQPISFYTNDVKRARIGASGGLEIAEGTNARRGVATLSAGAVTVSNTSITANTRIQVNIQSPSGVVGSVYPANVVAGVSFDILSTSPGDNSSVLWTLSEALT